MTHHAMRELANDATYWFFEQLAEVFDASQVMPDKHATNPPKHSEEQWAQMLVDAISSFTKGLDDVPNRVASINKESYDKALGLVGDEAFATIAMIVTAAGARHVASR